MAGYIYRDELLTHLRPLLEHLGIAAEALVTLRVTPRGIEVDHRRLPADPFEPLEFTWYNIADRPHVPPPPTHGPVLDVDADADDLAAAARPDHTPPR